MYFSAQSPKRYCDGTRFASRKNIELLPDAYERRFQQAKRYRLEWPAEQKWHNDVKSPICKPLRKLDSVRSETGQLVQEDDAAPRTFPENRECMVTRSEQFFRKALDCAHCVITSGIIINCRRCWTYRALTMSSTTFLASPNIIMVLSI